MRFVSWQILSDVVCSNQEVKKAERNLLSLLYNSRQDDYWRLSQKVSGTVAARKKVRASMACIDTDVCREDTLYIYHQFIQAEVALLSVRDKLQHYMEARTPLISLAVAGSLTFDLCRKCSSHQTTVISLTQFLHYFSAALRGDETDGEEDRMLESLATALQATAKVISDTEELREEREREENTWRTGILRELTLAVMKDAAQ